MKRFLKIFFAVAVVYAAGLGGLLLYRQFDTGVPSACDAVVPAGAKQTPVLDVQSSKDQIVVAEQPGGALLVDDQSAEAYASLYSDIAVRNDRACHWTSLEFKIGTSPYFQFVLHYLGGAYAVYYVYIDGRTMQVTSRAGTVEIRPLGDGWYRLVLAGANNRSGNRLARVQIYPRHGAAADTGSLLIRNAAFF